MALELLQPRVCIPCHYGTWPGIVTGTPDELRSLSDFPFLSLHPFERERVLAGLKPLPSDDTHGQVWLILGPDTMDTAGGYAVVTWS